MTLLDYLRQSPNPCDIELYHANEDTNAMTMVDFSLADFKPAGLEKFAKALNSTVVKINPVPCDVMAITLSGASVAALAELMGCHAGYCSVDEYCEWFTMDDDGPA